MTKNILLATAALGAIALAGQAQASEVTAAEVSNVALTVAAGTTSTFYTVANESITAGTAGATNRATLATANANDSTWLSGTTATPVPFIPGTSGSTSYTATYTLTGATFTNAVVAANQAVITGGACTVAAPVIVSGGGAGQNTVSILFTVATANGCTATGATVASAVRFDIPFTIDAAASTVSASVGFTVSASSAAYGGATANATLVQKQAGYNAGVSPLPQAPASGLPTSLSLSSTPVYSALVANSAQNDNIIGSVTAGFATPGSTSTGAVYANLSATNITSAPLAYQLAVSTNGGQFTSVQPRLASSDANALAGTATGDAVVINGTNTTYTYGGATFGAGLTGARTVFVVATGTAASSAQATTGTATFTNNASTIVQAPVASSIALETVTLQGTNFIAPWVGNQGAASTSVIRIANSGATTGPVALTILAPVTAANGVVTPATVTRTVCTSAQLPKLASIGASNELQLTSADFATCFGTTFTRADIRVSVQAVANNLSAKMRITSASSTTEQSLGAISADVATTN